MKKEYNMKKILLVGLLFSTQLLLSTTDIDRTYFYDQGVQSCDIKVFEQWLELGQQRDEIGNLILQTLGDVQETIIGDSLDDKIQHWDYELRTDLSLPSLMKSYNYQPFIFLLADLDRVDQLSAKIKNHADVYHYDTTKIVYELKKYKFKVVKLFEYAAKIGVNINAQDRWGDTALVQAIHYNSLEFVLLCIKAGAHVNHKGNLEVHQTPFVHAMFNLDLECFENSSVLNLESGIFDNNIEIIKVLIAAGADVTIKDKAGETVLDYMQVLISSFDDSIDYCVERFACLSEVDDDVFGSFDSKNFNAIKFKAHALSRYKELLEILQRKIFGYDSI